MKTRIYDFEAVNNFRDFGGYEGAGGRPVLAETLFRSAQFGNATGPDIRRLDDLNIAVQADLRRDDERQRHGHRWPQGGVSILKSDLGKPSQAPHVHFLNEVAVDAKKAEGWMSDYYIAAPYRDSLTGTYRAWFRELAALEPGQAALVNCAAGKDRTGILCALTHHVLGVDREAIFEDYLLTNLAAKVEQRLPEMAARYNAEIGQDYDADVYHPFIGVRAIYLEKALASIEAQSGSIDAYLADVLGVGPEETQKLRMRFLSGG